MHIKLSNLSCSDFIISLISYNFSNLEVCRALGKAPAQYAVFYANALPVPIIKRNRLVDKVKKLANLRHPAAWKGLFMKLPFQWRSVKPASLILKGGENSLNYRHPVNKRVEILEIHTLDYDIYLQEKNIERSEYGTAVFIDQFVPFQTDICEKPPMSIDMYYSLLNYFLDVVEKKTGLEVIIADHPRSNYRDLHDYFKGRKHAKDKTHVLVRESKLVLTHSSTAINFANLFYKPVIFITCSELRNTWFDYQIRGMAKWFGKKPIFMDSANGIDFKKELIVNKVKYDKYRQAYIKTKESQDLPFWQIVASRLKSGF